MRDRVLKARTAELYDGLLTNHLRPAFGDLGLSDIGEVTVRRWRKERLEPAPKRSARRAGDGGQGLPLAARHF